MFESQDCTDVSTTLFCPITHDVMINLRSIEQLSFATGVFFVADESGVYQRKAEGCTINLWRYSESERRIYISRSLLITDPQVRHFTEEYLIIRPYLIVQSFLLQVLEVVRHQLDHV